MDQLSMNLQTLARKYCIERITHLYKENPKIKHRFERQYRIESILLEIEKVQPEELKNLDQSKLLIRAAIQDAKDVQRSIPFDKHEIKAMNQERNNIIDYVCGLQESELKTIDRFFYRRVLTKQESDNIRGSLEKIWGAGRSRYWYPLDDSPPDDVVAFLSWRFQKEVNLKKIADFLSKQSDDRYLELREDHIDYEIDFSDFYPYYEGIEKYSCSKEMNWVIYSSHEESVTIAGKGLISLIKSIWPNWMNQIWKPELVGLK